jgi:hypothetical protein
VYVHDGIICGGWTMISDITIPWDSKRLITLYCVISRQQTPTTKEAISKEKHKIKKKNGRDIKNATNFLAIIPFSTDPKLGMSSISTILLTLLEIMSFYYCGNIPFGPSPLTAMRSPISAILLCCSLSFIKQHYYTFVK